MRLHPSLIIALPAVALAACTTVPSTSSVVATGPLATAGGEARGTANVSEDGGALRILVEATGMAPGTYGAHVHAVGRCDAPGFTSAGAHWNPTTRQHGRLNPAGSHHGDLPNLTIGVDGRGRIDAPLSGSLRGDGGLFDADGAALLIHAQRDDERTDPSGNSGDRIACAVLTAR